MASAVGSVGKFVPSASVIASSPVTRVALGAIVFVGAGYVAAKKMGYAVPEFSMPAMPASLRSGMEKVGLLSKPADQKETPVAEIVKADEQQPVADPSVKTAK